MRREVWVVLATLLASCASDPSGVVATGSSTTGTRAADQPIVTSKASPPDASASPPAGCPALDSFLPKRPEEGWFAADDSDEHPVGSIITNRPFANEFTLEFLRILDESVPRELDAQYGLRFGLPVDTVKATTDLCLTERGQYATYDRLVKEFKDDLGNTLTLRWISPLVGSFPWFTTPTGDDIEIRRDGGVDILLNDYSPSRQEVWVVDDDGTAFMIRMTGADSPNLAGWPTTFAPPLDAPEPQPSPLGVDALLNIAAEILVLDI